MKTINPTDPAYQAYHHARRAHWDQVAIKLDHWRSWGEAYQRRLAKIYRFLIPPGKRILELGSGCGDLLASLRPGFGLGLDFSPEMIARARPRHPELEFVQADAHEIGVFEQPFDVIILSDLINDLWDVQAVLEQLHACCHPGTRLMLNYHSRLWELPLTAARRLALARPELAQNWFTPEDVNNLLYLAGFEPIRTWGEILFPLPVPLLAPLADKFLARLWPFNHLALTNFTSARPAPLTSTLLPRVEGQGARAGSPTVSVIVPARNEAGNIPAIFARVPEMGAGTELVFVEGNSTDDTYAAIEAAIAANPQREARLFKQSGKGKGDAVRLGFGEAKGDILMILDADLTVPPEDLPAFYAALVTGKGEFINGVRLVYPMEDQAMRFLNMLGNKFFSLVFSWLLGQPIKDTLCGTKVLWKSEYEDIAANRSYFGDFDPFGDFDLLFGAARLNSKIVDLPVRYRERTYGSTNLQRWAHGWLLLRMVMLAARRLKFI